MPHLRNLFSTFVLVLLSIQSFAKGGITFLIKDIEKQPAENRLNYVLSMEYHWQKEAFRFAQIDSIKQVAQRLNDQALIEYVELIRLKYKIYHSKNALEKKKNFEIAEKFTEQSSNPELKAHLYFSVGIYAFYLKDVSYGLPLVYQAKRILEQIDYHKFRHRSYYYLGLIDLYYFFEDYNTAISYGELVLKNPYDLLFHPASYLNNIGFSYQRMKKYDKAIEYYNRSIADSKTRNDVNFSVFVASNIGLVYYRQGDFKRALPYLYKDLEVNNYNTNVDNPVRYQIASCLIHLDSMAKAETFLKFKTKEIPVWVHPSYKLENYRVFSLYYEKKGDFKRSALYKDSLIILNDSIKTQYDIKKLKLYESQMEAEKFVNQKIKLENEISRQKVVRNSVITFLSVLFLGIVGILFYRNKKEKQIQDQKQRLAEENIANANQQLTLFLNNIKEKNELIEKLTAELSENIELNPSLTEHTQEYLDKLKGSVILTVENWQEFKNIFEKIYPNFFENLLEKFPDLTPAETRLAALQKLDLPTKVMANMLGISTESIKKARYRLRKKYPELLSEQSQDEV